MVSTDAAVRSRLVPGLAGVSGPAERYGCQQNGVRQGFDTGKEGACGPNGEPARRMDVLFGLWGYDARLIPLLPKISAIRFWVGW